MLSFKANQFSNPLIQPLESVDFKSYRLLIATTCHSEDGSELSNIFDNSQKKMLADPNVANILKACDDETIVTFFDQLPVRIDDLVCTNEQHFGTKHIVIVSDVWPLENRDTCLVCKGERKWIHYSGLGREWTPTSESISVSSKEEFVQDAESDWSDIDDLVETEEDEKEENRPDSRPLSRCSFLSSASGRLPGTVEIWIDLYKKRSSEPIPPPRVHEIVNVLRQRAIVEGEEDIQQEIELVPKEVLLKIQGDLLQNTLFFDALYRYQEPELELQKFGYLSKLLRKTVAQILADATKDLDNFEPGIYVLELSIDVEDRVNKHKFSVPVEIIRDEEKKVAEPEQAQEQEQEQHEEKI